LHSQAIKVMEDPSYDHQFFAYVRAASQDDDYRSPSVWKAANPSFGVTMDEETFKADVLEAERSGGSKLAGFMRYRLNIWVHGENKFVNLTQWDRCKGKSGYLDKSRVWYCGLDLAQTWDVNAFVAVSKASDDVYDCLFRFWIPADNAHQRREEVPYVLWAKDEATGLVMTPGDTCDYEFIKRDILAFAKERQVAKVLCDPHNAHYLTQQLQAEGLTVLGFSQSFASMNSSTRMLETLISQGRLRTQDNPVINWMAGNAVTKTSAEGYIKIVKPASTSPARVDGMVALVMALAGAGDAEAAAKSPEPEILVL